MAPDTADVDFNDRQWRRRLTTALIEIIHEHTDGADVAELAQHANLTATELQAVMAYFRGASQKTAPSEAVPDAH